MKFRILLITFFLFGKYFKILGQVNLSLGLKAHYTFSGNANDISGNNLNGVTFGNIQLTTDRFGNPNSAYYFDGIDDKIIVYDNGALSTPSYSLVYYFMTESTSFQNCIGKINYNDGNGATYNSGIKPGSLNCYYATIDADGKCNINIPATFDYTITSPNSVQLNQWHCVVNTFNNGVQRIFLDGSLVKEQTISVLNAAYCTNTYFVIGDWWQNDHYRFKGKMDEIRYYDRALNSIEVTALCDQFSNPTCGNWLNTPSEPSSVNIGDLDVSGNQITIEAIANRTSLLSAGVNAESYLVSKNSNTSDANYILRPTRAQISTTNGFFSTPNVCDITLNKTYHYALVYNGSTLKFYRNGFLMSQVNATGNLKLNDLNTSIGNFTSTLQHENFIGYINEVRIWNVARTQSEIRANMANSLPNPTTQTGLKAYYVFDNLINKQGNTLYNGSLSGSATINSTNPQCTLIVDSCIVTPPDSNIINDYTPVISKISCSNKFEVEDATAFNVGDTILIIQMKGAVIDSTNTNQYGTITNYTNSGNYEYNYIKSKVGNTLELKNDLLRPYDIPDGKVQFVRVPYFSNYSTSASLSSLPWDGSKGGVLALNVQNTLTLSADINTSGNGFKGGKGINTLLNSYVCNILDYYLPSSSTLAALKGEGIADYSLLRASGRGAPANGGGGGLDHNSGGGGGGNFGQGGNGGNQWATCPGPGQNGGVGGYSLNYSALQNKIFLGGGGGAGHCNNLGFNSDGGNGGGIIIINCNQLITNNHDIISNGDNGKDCDPSGQAQYYCHEGMGGGGAGGTILINTQNFAGNTHVSAQGGKGANMTGEALGALGPGGGGGGGAIWLKTATTPPNIIPAINGGLNGINTNNGNTANGALPGNPGNVLFNLMLPVSSVAYTPNIDSVRFTSSAQSCNTYNFNGNVYFNPIGSISWQWYFGDGGTANTQNTSHTYLSSGNYTIKLIATDINGCKDSFSRVLNVSLITANAGADTSFCSNTTVIHSLQGSGTGTYSWSPAAGLSNPNIANPVAAITHTTTYYLTVSDGMGCSAIDSVEITVNPLPNVKSINDTSICNGQLLLLTTTGAQTYSWLPATAVNNPGIANPIFTGNTSQTVFVTGTAANGCNAKDTIIVTVKAIPVVKSIPDTAICKGQSITLTTTGANTYTWSPASGLNNPNIASPVFTGSSVGSSLFIVTGTATNGCKGKDSVKITSNEIKTFVQPPAKETCQGNSVILNGANGNSPQISYQWSPSTTLNDGTLQNPTAIPVNTQNYQVIITDHICPQTKTFIVPVTVNPLPNVNAKAFNDAKCSILGITLSASGANSYIWHPGNSLDDSTAATTNAHPNRSMYYTVIGTDLKNCSNTDTVWVKANNSPSDGDIYMPNIFTPNKDGKNDCFGLKVTGNQIKEFKFIIYNRWSNLVFSTNDPSKCWDGKYKNTDADTGTYIYYISGISECGYFMRKGSIILMR